MRKITYAIFRRSVTSIMSDINLSASPISLPFYIVSMSGDTKEGRFCVSDQINGIHVFQAF